MRHSHCAATRRRSSRHRALCALALACSSLIAFVTVSGASSSTTDASTNGHFSPAGKVALPGRGLSLAWSPAGDAVAAGGHFADPVTHQRYDTRTVDPRAMRITKGFECHYYWAIAQAWANIPGLGSVIADGGGDHAVKIWNANSTGSSRCLSPGQFRSDTGALHGLYEINGWTTSLAFSPDGKYLAGTSRDRAVRIWQLTPGPDQWKVVRLYYDRAAGSYFSVRWSPDGTRLITGDNAGRVQELTFSRWGEDMITQFAKVHYEGDLQWFAQHAAQLAPAPLWSDGLHKQVWNVRYSPDGRRVAAVGVDGTLSIFESRTGRVLMRVSAPDHTALHGLDWSPDGALIAAGGADKSVYVFSATDGSLYDRLTGHGTVVTAVAWSPNGRTLASTAGGQRISAALLHISQGPDNAVHFWTRK